MQVPEVYAARFLVAAKRTIGDILDNRPFDGLPSDAAALDAFIAGKAFAAPPPSSKAPPTTVPIELTSIEDQAKLLQGALKRNEGWWVKFGNTPIGVFAGEANAWAGILKGQRGLADLPKLERALEFERRAIRTYCAQTGKPLPRGV
jgi:hypothetical protein